MGACVVAVVVEAEVAADVEGVVVSSADVETEVVGEVAFASVDVLTSVLTFDVVEFCDDDVLLASEVIVIVSSAIVVDDDNSPELSFVLLTFEVEFATVLLFSVSSLTFATRNTRAEATAALPLPAGAKVGLGVRVTAVVVCWGSGVVVVVGAVVVGITPPFLHTSRSQDIPVDMQADMESATDFDSFQKTASNKYLTSRAGTTFEVGYISNTVAVKTCSFAILSALGQRW